MHNDKEVEFLIQNHFQTQTSNSFVTTNAQYRKNDSNNILWTVVHALFRLILHFL